MTRAYMSHRHTKFGPTDIGYMTGDEPGDSILAALKVDFVFDLHTSDDQEEEFVWVECDSATYDPVGATMGDVLVRAQTVLGRAVMIGEDGAEDCFGRDAIYEQVAHAILNDWRPSPCDYSAESADLEKRYRQRISREEAWRAGEPE